MPPRARLDCETGCLRHRRPQVLPPAGAASSATRIVSDRGPLSRPMTAQCGPQTGRPGLCCLASGAFRGGLQAIRRTEGPGRRSLPPTSFGSSFRILPDVPVAIKIKAVGACPAQARCAESATPAGPWPLASQATSTACLASP